MDFTSYILQRWSAKCDPLRLGASSVVFPKDTQLCSLWRYSCLLWTKDNDGKVSLNPNLFKLSKLILMLKSSPAQVSGLSPRVSPHGLPLQLPSLRAHHGNTSHEEVYAWERHQNIHAKFQQKDSYARFKPKRRPCGIYDAEGSPFGERADPSLGATSRGSLLMVFFLAAHSSCFLARTH